MNGNNLMGLFETQEYISSECHEWNVPSEMKGRVAKMVEKYNERAIKMGYNDSLLSFDTASLTLNGIFVPKAEKTSWLAKRLEDGRNADLSGDIMRILALCCKACPQCGNLIPALSKVCEICGKELLEKDDILRNNEIMPQESVIKENIVEETKEEPQHLRYVLFDKPIAVKIPKDVTYYDTVLSFFKDFTTIQMEKPKNHVNMGFTLDLDKVELADDEMIDENDIRLGVSAFDVNNEVFSRYNDCKPLFEKKVNNGRPQIFIGLHNSYLDINECVSFAEEHKISFAKEFGIDPAFKKDYESIVLSFDDDAEAATRFFCYVSDKMLSVPKDTPVTAYIDSDKSKAKAQKEYKKFFSFGAMDYAKGAMLLIKDKITGK